MAYRTIILKGDFTRGRLEFKAGAADIYPGMCCKINSSLDVVTSNSQGVAEMGMLIAIENDINGDEVSTVYTDDTQVQLYYALPGDILALRMETSEAIAIGDEITVQDTGDFEEALSGDIVVAIALEASSTDDDDTLVKCLVISPTYASAG